MIKNIKINIFLILFFLLFIFLLAILAPFLGLKDPNIIDPLNILASPSSEHWLGTDELGRDLLSRTIYGARVSLSVAFAAVLVACVVGVIIGVIASFLGPRLQSSVMLVVDIFVSMPEIFVALVILAFIGGNLQVLIFTIGLLYCPQFARVTWNVARSIQATDHVLSAISLGARWPRILRFEVLPNISSIVAVQASFTFSFAMLLEAGLSFLGLGVKPPTPSWGQMVGTLKDYIFINPWPVLVPSASLFITVLLVNLLGDQLQDILNPEA